MGYRFDFEKTKIVATGGIYVRTFPIAEQITIDSRTPQKPSFFSNSIFVQNLLPKNHSVLIEKSDYLNYRKILEVKENEVAKLENVMLFKKDIKFEVLPKTSASPFELLAQRNTPVIKNLVAFTETDNSILWLGNDGFFYQSDAAGKNPQRLTSKALKINKKGVYKIIFDSKNIFLNNNGELLFFNAKTNDFEVFSNSVKDAKISPDGKNIIYFAGSQIYIAKISTETQEKTLLYNSENNISDLVWLNNDYIIFTSGGPEKKIIISEIDYRGNVNAYTIAKNISSPAKILFNQAEGKLYVLSGQALLLSEKITP
jgi:hypothetical protein